LKSNIRRKRMDLGRATTPVIETERLNLRPIRENDAQAIFDCWMQDQEVSRYMCWKASDDIGDAKRFVEYERNQLENEQWNRWIVEDKSGNSIMGTCLIFYNPDEFWDIPIISKKYWASVYTTRDESCPSVCKVRSYCKENVSGPCRGESGIRKVFRIWIYV
jgi:hypothetical protein